MRLILLLLAVAACTPAPTVTRLASPLPASAGPAPAPVTRGNAALAADIMDLTFRLESGAPLPRLLRYEGPIRVHLGPAPATLQAEFAALIARLRAEAGLDIAAAPAGAADIAIELVPAARIERAIPGAACFVVPGVRSWAAWRGVRLRSALGGPSTNWLDQAGRGPAAIFLPAEAPPQEQRDCLHEELAQAIGPLNDLYELPGSVFNDDNVHATLTAFDMLVLRALYAPELANGMRPDAVAARLPAILDRLNPAGAGRGGLRPAPDPVWDQAFEAALIGSSPGVRRRAADAAVARARTHSPPDHRLPMALLTQGRLTVQSDADAAATQFAEAYQRFRAQLGSGDLRTANAAFWLAVLALRDGNAAAAIAYLDAHQAAADAAQDWALQARFAAVRARALAAAGRPEAGAASDAALALFRRAFGTDPTAIARRERALTDLLLGG